MAEDLMENPQGLKFKLDSATEKLNKSSVADALGVYLEELKALVRMTKAWVSRKYTKVNNKTILYTIIAVVYFVTPTDFVPDFILGIGFIDDMAVLTWARSLVKNDLSSFKEWEKNKKTKNTNKKNSKTKD